MLAGTHVLGVPADSDQNAINRAYSLKKYAARGNDAETARLEAAHSKLMMGALSARIKGVSVNKDILYADQEPLFPWKPK
ncbi:glycosyl hydrolase [Monoraphidium neglectum]|uniref:Glycosyl hydrolase n=1 Tax=Monoraphidium neglectum TaxID=145388 RepID=A0A0D2KF87_9CHLO|nr:glycosyl hydrolase [Monoraphidium neglectum]KIY94548.1 glycosyl hydrolase [Monoraphidium neglectum]|eukprot:XP_013893568.1 glycosyl hydrolase [Monoraphidium neglectum]